MARGVQQRAQHGDSDPRGAQQQSAAVGGDARAKAAGPKLHQLEAGGHIRHPQRCQNIDTFLREAHAHGFEFNLSCVESLSSFLL